MNKYSFECKYKSKYNLDGWSGFINENFRCKILCPGIYHAQYFGEVKGYQSIRFYGKNEAIYDDRHSHNWFDDRIDVYIQELVNEIEKMIDKMIREVIN